MEKSELKTIDLIEQTGQQLTPAIKEDNCLEQFSRVMTLDDIFFKNPLQEAAKLLQKNMITDHNLKAALLTLIIILSAKLNKPMGLMLATSDLSIGMKILKQCMILAPEETYKECGQLNIAELFCSAEGLNGKAIISLEPSGFIKTWKHLEKMLNIGYSMHTEVIKSSYNTFTHSNRTDSLVSIVGIITGMIDRNYNNPIVLKVPLHVDEYPLSQLLCQCQDGIQSDLSTEVATVRLRETLARLRPMKVDIPFSTLLFTAIKVSNAAYPERKLEMLLKVISICCIINNADQVTREEIIARIYKIDIRKLNRLQTSSLMKHQLDPEKLPVLTATKIDYYHAWLLMNEMIPIQEISLSDRQIKVFEVIKKINFGKLNNSFSENNVIKQLSQISTSSTYWARREKIFEEFNKNGHEEASQSTIYIELQHLIKEGLIAEDKYPKSTSKGYYVATFEAGKNIKLPHPSEIIDDEFKGEKLQVINPLTGQEENI